MDAIIGYGYKKEQTDFVTKTKTPRQKAKSNIEIMEAIIVPFIVFSCTFGIVFVFLTTRNKERLALIEKGQNADLFNNSGKNQRWPLKLGILSIGVAAGIITGNMLSGAGMLEEEVAFPFSIFLFAGIALVVSYLVNAKLDEKQKDT